MLSAAIWSGGTAGYDGCLEDLHMSVHIVRPLSSSVVKILQASASPAGCLEVLWDLQGGEGKELFEGGGGGGS